MAESLVLNSIECICSMEHSENTPQQRGIESADFCLDRFHAIGFDMVCRKLSYSKSFNWVLPLPIEISPRFVCFFVFSPFLLLLFALRLIQSYLLSLIVLL
jgi:hypothetical protein